MKTQSLITDLNTLLNSSFYDAFTADRLGNDLFLSDPERADRCHKAAEHGADGSTHAERLQDMADANEHAERELYRPQFLALGFPQFTADALATTLRDEIAAEIQECEAWHEKNGTLNSQIG